MNTSEFAEWLRKEILLTKEELTSISVQNALDQRWLRGRLAGLNDCLDKLGIHL